MIRKVVLYPFCIELFPYVKYFSSLQDEYSLCGLVSPKGLSLEDEDAAYVRNLNNIGIKVASNIEHIGMPWDTLLVVQDNFESLTENIYSIEDMLLSLIQNNKTVIWCKTGRSKLPAAIECLAQNYPDNINISTSKPPDYDLPNLKPYVSLSTPIVLAGGLIKNTPVAENLLYLANRFTENNFRPAVITKLFFGEFFGFHHIYDIYCDCSLTEAEKITVLNRIISQIEHEQNPDIILIEAPDALMQYNANVPNGYGIQSIMLAKAAHPDYILCCTPLSLFNCQFIDDISASFSHVYGTPISCVFVDNSIIDAATTNANQKVSTLNIDADIVCDRIKQESLNDLPAFCNSDFENDNIYNFINTALF